MVTDAERRAELSEHLAELRTRLIRVIIYVVTGAVVAWFLYDWIFENLTKPMLEVMEGTNIEFLLTSWTEGFMIRMQICLVSGLILTLPLVTAEFYGFIAPGLTPEERKPLKWMTPLSAVLFICGVVLCYFILPTAFDWFLMYVPDHSEFKPSLQGSILFMVKMLLAFGLVFQLPVVLTILAKVGIVDSQMLKENWRVAIVAVSIVAAVATPSNDAFSMLMMATPVAMLYFLSIGLVRMVEGKTRKKKRI